MLKYKFILFSLTLVLQCNFIPASVTGSSITGKDVKKELKKAGEASGSISSLLLVSSINTSITSVFGLVPTLKTCPGYTTDSDSPSFSLPAPTAYSNVNLTGNVSSSMGQSWTSEPITTRTSIQASLISSTRVSCKYNINSIPTVSNSITIISALESTINVSTVPAILYLNCISTLTNAESYTLSLNPRPSSSSILPTTTSSAFSIESLIPDELLALVANIEDDQIYTYDSFEICKANFIKWSFASAIANDQAFTNFTQCGGYDIPPNQIYFQGATCNLKKAGLIEF